MNKEQLLSGASWPAATARPDTEKNATQATEQQEFLTEAELAERWRITVRKLQKDRLQGGSVAFLKLGGAIRYRMADVLAYEAAHQFQSTSEYRS